MRFAAIDLGASSGRVITGVVDDDRLELVETHRFPNRPVQVRDTLYWDILALYQGVLDGVAAAGELDGIGVDSWAVDYGLLDADGALLGNPVHYRDARTAGVADRMPVRYAATGIAVQPFNTVYQLAVEHRPLRTAVLIPDLISYWLGGELGTELTNASTTGLLDVRTRQWSPEISLPDGLFPPLRSPGTLIGAHNGVPIYTVGSHDTASAVAAVPTRDENFAFISCGTWSLAGVELAEPVITDAARDAGFTNELGVDGTIRFLRNVMGLWLLQELGITDLPGLLAAAADVPGGRSLVDATDPRFLSPGDMPARIAAACREGGYPEPENPPQLARCVLDSLALAHRDAIADAARLSGKRVDAVHIVGGGARNALLCQLTADACGLPVIAGPAEATALGNILVQARAAGALHGDLFKLRDLVQPLRFYHPVTTS